MWFKGNPALFGDLCHQSVLRVSVAQSWTGSSECVSRHLVSMPHLPSCCGGLAARQRSRRGRCIQTKRCFKGRLCCSFGPGRPPRTGGRGLWYRNNLSFFLEACAHSHAFQVMATWMIPPRASCGHDGRYGTSRSKSEGGRWRWLEAPRVSQHGSAFPEVCGGRILVVRQQPPEERSTCRLTVHSAKGSAGMDSHFQCEASVVQSSLQASVRKT